MPPLDPVTGAELAGGGVYLTRQVTKAIGRVIGPAVDEIAEALRAYTAFRLRNVQRIAERAEAKQLKTGRKGNVPPRLAHRILEEGSYCDDELMTEYLGGLLAGSRSPSGRDDRAATLCALVTSMSTLQVRAHYILYREWAFLLHGRTDVNIGVTAGRGQATLVAPTNVFASLLDPEGTLGRDVATHAITGLQRVGLLGDEWEMGNPDKMLKPPHPAPFRHLLHVQLSIVGVELYGWAQGLPGLSTDEFPTRAEPIEIEPAVPRLEGAYLPNLPALPQDAPDEAHQGTSPSPDT